MDTEKTKGDRALNRSSGLIEDTEIKALAAGRAIAITCVDWWSGN
jgi:hypothetical protein